MKKGKHQLVIPDEVVINKERERGFTRKSRTGSICRRLFWLPYAVAPHPKEHKRQTEYIGNDPKNPFQIPGGEKI